MNNVFSIDRFGKLMVSDAKRYLPKFFGTFMIFLIIMPAIWLINVFIDGSLIALLRVNLILFFAYIVTFIAPFKMYGQANNKKWGVDFIMLPASSLEKFVVMVLFVVIIIPISFIVLSLCLDFILYMLPFNVYKVPITMGGFFNTNTFKILGSLVACISVALFGNMFFKKSKLFKTLFSIFIFICIFSALGSVYIKSKMDFKKVGDEEYSLSISANPSEGIGSNVTVTEGRVYVDGVEVTQGESVNLEQNFINAFKAEEVLLYILFYAIIPGLCYFFTYYKIKTEEL